MENLLNSDQEFLEIPLNLYCNIRNISKRTFYNMRDRGEIDVVKKNSKNYVLVPSNELFILNEKNLLLLDNSNKSYDIFIKRRNKKIISNLNKVLKNIQEVIFLLSSKEN